MTALAVLAAVACGGPNADDEAAEAGEWAKAATTPARSDAVDPPVPKGSELTERTTIWDYYGNPWSPTYLANLPLQGDTRVSYRFLARTTGEMLGIQNYFTGNVDREGYGSGTGGSIRIQLVPDDGAGLPAMETILAETVWRPGLVDGWAFAPGSSTTDGHPTHFAQKNWDSPAAIEAGHRYHVVFENTDSESEVNWISLNNSYATRDAGRGPLAPPVDDWGATLDLGDGRGFGENTGRERLDNNGNRYEINLLILMADGSSYGNAYMEAKDDYTVAGESRVRQVFTPRASIEVDRLTVFAAGVGRLRVTLIRDGSEITSWAITTSDEDWAHHLVSLVPFILEEGVEYALEFSADDGSFVMGTFRDGSLGTGEVFGPGGSWSDGHAEYTIGRSWEPVFFTYADLTGVAFGRAG